ncbi:MAG: hypothetical protein QW348_02585 [Ignisphaera sp.]
MGERPTAAFVLSLIGGLLITIESIIAIIVIKLASDIATSMVPGINASISAISGLVMAVSVLGIVLGIIIVIGSLQIRSGVPNKVRTWSIIVLVLSVISVFTGGGFFIGFILGLVGGILGLVWKPSKAESATSAPSSQAQTT